MMSSAPTTHREPPRLLLPTGRRRSAGLWVSLALHAAVLALLWVRRDALIPTPLPGDPRLGTTGGGGGGGGGAQSTTYIIALPPVSAPAPAATPVPPIVTTPKVEVPVARPTPIPMPVVADTHVVAPGAGTAVAPGSGAGAGPGSGGGSGGGQGGGTGPGTGPGSGSGSGGEGGGIRPPELRGLAIPFSTPPKELRGKTVKVIFSITADGRVERFETDPPITNRGYYQKFSEVVLGFRFKPARGPDGQPVAVVYSMEFTLPTQ